jgi:hypothetical protein
MNPWPPLPLEAWKDTYATLHMWLQIVGKVRLTQSAWINHSWHSTFYVSARGLTTSAIPYGTLTFEIEFDFISHQLEVRVSNGSSRTLPLRPQSVAAFYRQLMQALTELGLPVRIHVKPNEVVEAIPFDRDETHHAYDPESAASFWRILAQSDRVFRVFRGRFIGKCSPVHFFWGGPDLAVTRFSGRTAPTHPGGIPNLPDAIAIEAYSHEVSSCGFWPGGGPIPHPAFYAYAYPEPAGFADAPVGPDGAFYSTDLREFLLPYDRVANAPDPDAALLEFMQTTYDAAARLAAWDSSLLRSAP